MQQRSRLTRFVARRFLFSRKSHAVINLVSCVSALAVAVPAAAMVVLFSVYNGLDDLLKSMYGNFDLPVRITAAEGKSFVPDSSLLSRLAALEGVDGVTETVEENALAEYRGRQHIVTVRGVDTLYDRVVPVREMVEMGEYRLKIGDLDHTLIGMGVAYTLGVNINMFDKISLYAPAPGASPALLPGAAPYNKRQLFPNGVFTLDADTDGSYMLVPLDFARSLFGLEGRVTALGLGVQPGYEPQQVARNAARVLGPEYRVQDRYQQKESIYRIMKYEKAGIFLICVLVLLVASLTLVSTLMMLIIDKQQGIFTLRSMGADTRLIRAIFTTQGVYISLAGIAAGVAAGLVLSLLQQYYGLIPIEGKNMLLDAYPVRVQAGDLLLIVCSIALIDYLIARLTVAGVVR